MKFAQFSLDSRLLEAVATAGYVEPTPIQKDAIPVVLSGRDLVGLAQTGTGKTAAFALPALQRLLQDGDPRPAQRSKVLGVWKSRQTDKAASASPRTGASGNRSPRVLVVAPTRELAEQIRESFATLGRYTQVRTVAIYGGVSKVPQTQTLRRGTDVVVACPGRLLDLHGEGQVDLSRIEMLVLDEADHLLDMGFLPDVQRILRLLPRKRQTLLFSATMPAEIRQLAASALHDPAEIRIGRTAPAATVSQGIYEVEQGSKTALLLSLMEAMRGEKVLVFTRTKHRAKGLARKLENAGHRVSDLQGNMAQNQRQRAIDGFRRGKIDVLVATDIAARGIDVPEIGHVINFDITDTVEAHTHRIGRTGRAERLGRALTFVSADDRDMLRALEKNSSVPLVRMDLPDVLHVHAASLLSERAFRGSPGERRSPGGRPSSGGRSSTGGSGSSPRRGPSTGSSPAGRPTRRPAPNRGPSVERSPGGRSAGRRNDGHRPPAASRTSRRGDASAGATAQATVLASPVRSAQRDAVTQESTYGRRPRRSRR